MNFEATGDLAAFLDAVDDIATRAGAQATLHGQSRHEPAPALEQMLEEGGYFACATEESLGVLAATAMVMALARLPVGCEFAASALVAPLVTAAIGRQLPRPLAVTEGDANRPLRHLPQARTLLRLGRDDVRIAALHPEAVVPVESAFAYPMGVLRDPAALHWQPVEGVAADMVRDRWRLGVAAEMVGCLQAGLAAVVTHVTDRRQFGRPLGAFQGVQHRLAAAASSIEAARWLTLEAAWTGQSADATTALAQLQGISTKIVYDLHQFMGAMGLTLEHPLHRWTYRLKLLRSECGGAERQFAELARGVWGEAA